MQSHHPAYHVSAENVQDHIKVIVAPLYRPAQLGDVPTPDLIWTRGQELWYGIGRVADLVPPLPYLAGLGKDTVHGALRAEVANLIKQRGIDLGRGHVHETLTV